jgi:hypothetical protein
MADYAISNVPRRVVFAPSGVGPYSFTFEILTANDIAVYKGTTLLTLTTDYTVTINANGTGSVTLVASAGTDNIAIVGAKTIQRTTDFVTGGDFFANTLNDELDAQTIYIQQVAETAERSLKAPVTDPTSINMTLPTATLRANKYLSFDANGNPSVSESFTDAYIGGAAVNPTTDSSGNPLTEGDLYFNTTSNEMLVYDGTTWIGLTDFGGTVSTLTVVNNATLPSIIGPTNITSATLPSPTITGTATVGAANLSGNLSVGGTVGVTGAATLSSTLNVTGAVVINNAATIGVNTTLGVAITSSVSTSDITVASTTGFPTSGTIQIDSEIIAYTGKSATTFTGITRAQSGTTGATHLINTRVYITGIKIKGSVDDPLVLNINSTEPALRVTQIGTGDVLRVEDQASPDTSRLTISNAGALTLNNSTTFNSGLIMGATSSETWSTYGIKSFNGFTRFFYQTHDYANEGEFNYPLLQRHQKLSADGTAIGPTIADYFGATSQAQLNPDCWYEFEYVLYFTKTTAGTLTFTIATDQAPQLLSAEYIGTVIGGIGAVGAPQMAAIIKSTSTAAALPVTGSLTTAVNHKYSIKGIIRTATTFNSLMKLRVTNSAGTVTPLAGSYQKMWRISDLDAAGIFL